MAWFSNFFNGAKGSSDTVVGRIGGFLGFAGGGADSTVLTPHQSMEVSAVYSAVRLIAQRVSATPFILMELEQKNARYYKKEAVNHWAAKLFNGCPNPYQTTAEFLETIMLSALLGSGALIYKAKDRTGKVVELWPIPIGTWTQEVMGDGSEQFRVNLADGTIIVYNSDDVIFIHGPGFDGYSAFSPIVAARQVLGISNSLTNTQKSFADNAGAPRGILNTEEMITDNDEKKALEEAFKAKFSPGGSGLLMLHNKTSFTNMSENMNNSQFIQQRELVIREVAMYFNIPLSYLNGGARTEQDAIALDQDAIRPWIIRIEQALNSRLLNNDPKYKFDADEFAHMRSDPLKQIDFIQKALGSGGVPGIISQNEARKIIMFNPIDDAKYDEISAGGYGEVSGLSVVQTAGKKKPKPEQQEE